MPIPSLPEWMLPFTPHEHDVRIARNGWVFYVRAVKVGEPFLGDVTWDGTLVACDARPHAYTEQASGSPCLARQASVMRSASV